MPPSRRADSTIALDGDGGRSGTVVAWAVVMTVLAAVSVGLRFYVRGKMLRAIGREDWCILLALVSLVGRGPSQNYFGSARFGSGTSSSQDAYAKAMDTASRSFRLSAAVG